MATTLGDEIMEDLLLIGGEEEHSAQTMTVADLALLDAAFHIVDRARWTLSLAMTAERDVALFPDARARNHGNLTSLTGRVVQWPERRAGACWTCLK